MMSDVDLIFENRLNSDVHKSQTKVEQGSKLDHYETIGMLTYNKLSN